ncbi:hypothetical protein COOONC_17969, partial [Cooperia oncophora]
DTRTEETPFAAEEAFETGTEYPKPAESPIADEKPKQYPAVTELVTATMRYEMESPEEFEKRMEEVPPKPEEEYEKRMEEMSPKREESPVTVAEREEYPTVTEVVTTTTRYEMESPEEYEKRMEEVPPKPEEEYEKRMEEMSPKREESPVTVAEREEYPTVTEVVTTTTRYEMESPEEYEKRMEEMSPKREESPVTVAEREEYPTVTEVEVYLESPEEYEQRMEEVPPKPEEEYEKRTEEMSPKREVAWLSEESPVTVAEREEYPTVTEVVTTTTRYEMESPEEYEKRMEEVPPKPETSNMLYSRKEESAHQRSWRMEEFEKRMEEVSQKPVEEFEKRYEDESPKREESPAKLQRWSVNYIQCVLSLQK